MMDRFLTASRRWLLANWGVLLFALFLLFLIVLLKVTTSLSLIFLFLISAFVFALAVFPVKTKRLWLIPMFLLLPLICIPGELAVISCVPEWSQAILVWLNSLFPSSLVQTLQERNALLLVWIGSAWAVWILWVLYICWRGTTPRHPFFQYSSDFTRLMVSCPRISDDPGDQHRKDRSAIRRNGICAENRARRKRTFLSDPGKRGSGKESA